MRRDESRRSTHECVRHGNQTSKQTFMARRYLLSIDGGGIRGIIPAMALLKLEQITNRPARETFAFAAGTSTGAILAASVAAGIPASRIVSLYKYRGRDIFKPQKPWSTAREYTCGHKYDTENLHDVMRKEFGAAAGWRLNDSPIDILITAKGLADTKPWYFVKDQPNNSRLTGNLQMIDCATASAAAPTYFNPWQMPAPVSGKLVDGGVGVTGNPVYQACVEAFYYSPGYTPEETTIVSFGTGRFVKKSDPKLITDWLTWVLNALLHAPGEQQTELVERHFSQSRFYRFEPDLPEDIDMDDISRINDLEETGRRFAEQVNWDAILKDVPE
jgi:predicted patatin/cPLA2 family phospholipase